MRQLWLTFLCGVVGCGQGERVPAFGVGAAAVDPTSLGLEGTCQAGLEAFSQTVFPRLRSHCVACHDLQPPRSSGPRFAVDDAAQSYGSLVRLQNFDDIAASWFVTKGGNLHCRAYSGGSIDCATTAQDLEPLVRAWWELGERQCARRGRYFSRPLLIPADLPRREDGFRTLRVQLGTPANPALRDVVFEVDAQTFAPASREYQGALRLIRPRLLTPTHPVYLSRVQVLINGGLDSSASAFRSIRQTVAPERVPASVGAVSKFPLLSAASIFVAAPVRADSELVVTLEEAAQAPQPACAALAKFESQVLPALATRRCHQCHGGGPDQSVGNEARERFDMGGDSAQLCRESLMRLSPVGLMRSVLVDVAYRGVFGHPQAFAGNGDVETTFGEWYQDEQAADSRP